MSFFRSKEIDIKKEKVDEIEAFAEGKGLGERALGIRNDEFNDVIDKVFVVNVVIDEAIRYCKSIVDFSFLSTIRGQETPSQRQYIY